MLTYQVTLEMAEKLTRAVRVTIEARNAKEARAKALDMAVNGKIRKDNWHCIEHDVTDVFVVDVEQEKE
jgi:hypothetical protein